MPRKYEILSIGNAIMDILGRVPEWFISDHSLEKGSMRLVDAQTSARLLHGMKEGPLLMTAGGSAANTAACIGLLGGRSAYVGKIGDDAQGHLFRSSMEKSGVDYHCGRPHPFVPTASCVAAVTPDGERTMSTHLGACRELGPEDVPEDLVANSELLFLEGYLLDSPTSNEALRLATRLAAYYGTVVAITLSDANCVRRHLETLRELIVRNHVQIVVANEKEMSALFDVDEVEEAFRIALGYRQTFVVTMGSRGSAVLTGRGDGKLHGADAVATHVARVPAVPVSEIVDLVGAGDSFAAGYLLGRIRWNDDVRAASLGAACASAVISTAGARPARPFSDYEDVRRQTDLQMPVPTARHSDKAVEALLGFDRAAVAHLERHGEIHAHDPETWDEVVERSAVMSSMCDDHLLAYMASFRLLARRLEDGRDVGAGTYRSICVDARRNAFAYHVQGGVLSDFPI